MPEKQPGVITRLIPKERLERVLGLPERAGWISPGAKTA